MESPLSGVAPGAQRERPVGGRVIHGGGGCGKKGERRTDKRRNLARGESRGAELCNFKTRLGSRLRENYIFEKKLRKNIRGPKKGGTGKASRRAKHKSFRKQSWAKGFQFLKGRSS